MGWTSRRSSSPTQGALALADPSDTHTRADWEAAAAAVLRKSHLLASDDADSEVWARLTRTTLDGLAVPPLGTPDLLEDLETSGRPTRVGGWDVVTRPTDKEQALADLDTGATALWVAADADLAALLAGVLLDLAPVVLDGATPDQARHVPRRPGVRRAGARHQSRRRRGGRAPGPKYRRDRPQGRGARGRGR